MSKLFKRGDKYLNNGEIVTICGVEDYEDYEQDRPNEKWELIRVEEGPMFWVGNIHLHPIDKQNEIQNTTYVV